MVQLTKENLIYIGASGTIAVAALALIGSGIFSGATTEGLEIGQTSIKKASGNAVITIQVKNAGTSEIIDTLVQINGVTLGVDPVDFSSGGLTGAIGTIARNNDGEITGGLTPGATGTDCDPSCTITFENTPDLDAGQTVSYSATIPSSNGLNVGDSFVVTATGQIDGSDISISAVATVTRF